MRLNYHSFSSHLRSSPSQAEPLRAPARKSPALQTNYFFKFRLICDSLELLRPFNPASLLCLIYIGVQGTLSIMRF
jgi:hypothetical protein